MKVCILEIASFPKQRRYLLLFSCSVVRLFATPWTAARQASPSFTISWSLLKLMSIELVMPSLCRPLLLRPSVFPSIRVFSSESGLHIRWPNYWSFSIRPSNEYSGCAYISSVQFSCSGVTPWNAENKASLSITNSWSLLRLMSIESVIPSNHLILCCPLLLLPSIFPSIRVFFQ